MKKFTTAERLKQIMVERGLKQVDIINACTPYCDKYGVKLNKNDLSQYVAGKVQPGQEKLSILSAALNVSEVWLMGYDVSPVVDESNNENTERPCYLFNKCHDINSFETVKKFLSMNEEGKKAVTTVINGMYPAYKEKESSEEQAM